MTTQPQPEALRLADALLEPVVLDRHAMQAAAELRRLHAECEALRADRDSWERQCSDRVDDAVEFLQQRDEARAECEALRKALERISGFTMSQFASINDMALECVNVANDALAARAAKEQSNG